ncbi:MAG: non-canonical purine NTP pyrophosphatase, partial [Desulfomonilaceae bacterium]
MSIQLDKIVVATRNSGKFIEIKKLLQETDIKLLSLSDFPEIPEVVEDGATFEDNALKKAKFVASSLGVTALADDSGLCVDALSGRPGVMSARYGGPNCNDRQRFVKLLEEMKEI